MRIVFSFPDPQTWLSGETDWDPSSDVINLPMDISDEQVPQFRQNSHEASDVYYDIVAAQQRSTLPTYDTEYPFTEDVKLTDGTLVRLKLQRRLEPRSDVPRWEPFGDIEGVGWARHPILPSGQYSGFVPLLDGRPFYIVDHGHKRYTHDAYGLHLGQEDRLTFLGPESQSVTLHLLDCRSELPSLGRRFTFEFAPTPSKVLVIPNGVAHAFDGLENVFTLNQPKIYSDNEEDYSPGNDVTDLPLNTAEVPVFVTSRKLASDGYYQRLVLSQLELLTQPPEYTRLLSCSRRMTKVAR